MMKRALSLTILFTISVLFSTAAISAQDPVVVDKDKLTGIRKLMIADGTMDMSVALVNVMYENLRQTYPDAPDSFWEGAQETMSPFYFLERLVAIYDKHLSKEEVEALIKFYESPQGKKLVQTSPVISMESAQVMQLWSQRVAQILENKLQEAQNQQP